jgi:hypothetical protein
MSKVETLERKVEQLTKEEFGRFRDWFVEFEWQAWDRQIEQDSKAGKLDRLAQKALDDYAAGQTKRL